MEEDGDGGGGLKRNYHSDMGSFRVLSNDGLVMVVVQGTGRRLGFHHHKTIGKSSDLESQKSSHPALQSSRHLLEQNNRVLGQISTNIHTLKLQDNYDLFWQIKNSITVILNDLASFATFVPAF
ncbi:hypothetical protein HanXRQr2_Chr01g0012691 [Helianthus annuus]|uniref:Uncharacterized protein n=1 Tax=Helianthus annuus TaxID=4232 RepID=A0A251VM72_HELAN|nr:hypothetical protein HanXRQr2_Chr01g0012691 [Helianthus annuus]KAJ0626281.1 hypothetical protein HanHA89_Chr01g0011371 [Helianthus annuus]